MQILKVVEYPVTYTKFQGNLFVGSGEEDFLKDISTYGHGSHIDHVTWMI